MPEPRTWTYVQKFTGHYLNATSHLDDLVLAHTVVREFVVKAFRDQFQHLIALLPAGDFFVALLVHPCASRTISTSRDSFKLKKRSSAFRNPRDHQADQTYDK
jgi:hypothetical protein